MGISLEKAQDHLEQMKKERDALGARLQTALQQVEQMKAAMAAYQGAILSAEKIVSLDEEGENEVISIDGWNDYDEITEEDVADALSWVMETGEDTNEVIEFEVEDPLVRAKIEAQ